jgi:hypothetical protein
MSENEAFIESHLRPCSKQVATVQVLKKPLAGVRAINTQKEEHHEDEDHPQIHQPRDEQGWQGAPAAAMVAERIFR